jgi:hypothetical protein
MNRDAVTTLEEARTGLPREKLPGQYQILTIDESFYHEDNRIKHEARAVGRLFIPKGFVLDAPLIHWIRRMEDVMGYRIFASPEHLELIGESAIQQRRGVDA